MNLNYGILNYAISVLSGNEFKVFTKIYLKYNFPENRKNGSVELSNKYIRKACKLSDKTVTDAFTSLQYKQFITNINRGKKTANNVNATSSWKVNEEYIISIIPAEYHFDTGKEENTIGGYSKNYYTGYSKNYYDINTYNKNNYNMVNDSKNYYTTDVEEINIPSINGVDKQKNNASSTLSKVTPEGEEVNEINRLPFINEVEDDGLFEELVNSNNCPSYEGKQATPELKKDNMNPSLKKVETAQAYNKEHNSPSSVEERKAAQAELETAFNSFLHSLNQYTKQEQQTKLEAFKRRCEEAYTGEYIEKTKTTLQKRYEGYSRKCGNPHRVELEQPAPKKYNGYTKEYLASRIASDIAAMTEANKINILPNLSGLVFNAELTSEERSTLLNFINVKCEERRKQLAAQPAAITTSEPNVIEEVDQRADS